MRDIIEDWLTLAKIEGGHLVQHNADVDLKPVLTSILDSYQGLAAADGLSLTLDMPDDQYVVTGDHNSYGVLFDNLIVNAIKYNKPGGSVTVTGTKDAGEVVVSVADTGIGVSDEDLPFLFEEFYRGKDRGEKGLGGTGLGLPICRRIVTELGGCIEVESKVGAGSVFRVRLPAQTEKQDGGNNVGNAGAKAPANDTPGR